MMSGTQARAHLALLGLSQVDAADLLGTNARTVRRWVEDEMDEIPGPADQALRAWVRLHQAGLAWRPDHRPLTRQDEQVQAARRQVALAANDVAERVRRLGGPTALWDVDLVRQRATLGAMQLQFALLNEGGFVPQSYRPGRDTSAPGGTLVDAKPEDATADAALLEDGYACIARALARADRPSVPAFRLAPAVAVGDRLLLWEDRAAPTLVLVIEGAVLRAVMGPLVSVEEGRARLNACRLELAQLAQQLASEGAGEVGALGVREISVHETPLRRWGLARAEGPRPVKPIRLARPELRSPDHPQLGPTA